MMKMRLFVLAMTALVVIDFSSSISLAKQDVAHLGSPPPLSEDERSVGNPGVQFSNVIEAKGKPNVADGVVRQNETLLSIPYAYRYTAVLTEDVKGYSLTVRGVQAPAGSPGYYAGTFYSMDAYGGVRQRSPMDMWCFLPRVAGGKRENICLLRNDPKRAAIAPTKRNPYLWSNFSSSTGSFDYVNTPIFKRQAVELPFQPILEYKFVNWEKNTALIELYAMGILVRKVVIDKNSNDEFRLRTIIGDFLLEKNGEDLNSTRIIFAESEAPKIGSFARVKLTIDANSRLANCEVIESDTSKQFQEKVCEIYRLKRKFPVSSTTIEKIVRIQPPGSQ